MQCKQILQMIQASFRELITTANSAPLSWGSYANTVNAGIHNDFVGYAKYQNTETMMWILDFGAIYHITPHLTLLTDVQTFHSSLHLLNGNTADITHIGRVILAPDLILDKVLFVPSFLYNLLSVSQLTKDNNYIISFDAHRCFIQDSTLKIVKEIGNAQGGLYILPHTLTSVNPSIQCQAAVQRNTKDSELWHVRLSHPVASSTKYLSDLLPSATLDFSKCDTCHLAKQSRCVFPVSTTEFPELFDLIHVDV